MKSRTALIGIVGLLLSFFFQRFTSLITSFVVLSIIGKTKLLGELMLYAHLNPTLPPIVFQLRTIHLLIIVSMGLLLFLLCNAGLMLWSRRKSVALMRGVQIGFIFALLPLYAVAQIFLVQHGLQRAVTNLEELEATHREIIQHSNDGDCESLAPAQQTKCFSRLATEKKNPEFCTRIGSESTMDKFRRDFCFSDVAESAQNPDVCHRIQRSSLAATCIKDVLGLMNMLFKTELDTAFPSHGDLCERYEPKGDLDEIEKAACYKEVALYERNPSLCEHLLSPGEQDQCRKAIAEKSQ